MTTSSKQGRGFQGMDPDRRREIASMGGKAALSRHQWTVEEAREAGRKGQQTRRERKEREVATKISL